MSNKKEVRDFLMQKRGYLKTSATRIAEAADCSIEIAQEVLKDVRYSLKEMQEALEDKPEPRVLIYDIETSYNIVKSWRVGYKLNLNPGDIIHERAIICVSYKWQGEDEVYNLVWDDNQCDKFLLEQFIEVLNEADLIVAHNGDRYDLKFIKTRAIFHGLPMMVKYNQFDTLKVAKSKFMFNSNKLDYISKFLGAKGKISTEMKLWDDIILNQCPDALQKMLEYCDEDVRQLEYVYDKLVSWDNPRIHAGVLNGEDKTTSPISGGLDISKVKMVTTSRGTVKYIMKDNKTDRQFEMSEANYKKYKSESE